MSGREDSLFTFVARAEGGHVRVAVRAGQAGQRALVGTLILRPVEWDRLKDILRDEVWVDNTVSAPLPSRHQQRMSDEPL